MGNPLQVRDGNGNVRRTEYNVLNLAAKVYDPAPFESRYAETTYYRTGKVKTATDRRKNITGYEYDELNRVVKVTDPLTQTVETTYDKVGNVKTVKDKRTILTETDYNELNLVKEKRRAGLRLVTNKYDAVGNLRFITDAKGYRIEHQYNKRNLPETTIYPATALYPETKDTKTYDGVGNVLTDTDEESKVTTYTYDNENRQKTVELAGELTEKRYDEVGNLTEVIKPEGNSRAMGYDGLKRLTSVTEGGLTTRYEYDANGNTRHQYDARNNDVEFIWDELNRKKQHIQHKGSGNLITTFAEYDAEGNLKRLIDPKGQEFTYNYDELNRRTDEYFPTTVTPYLTLVKVHTDYDGNNNVTSTTETKKDENSATVTDSTINTYDNFDRLKTSATRGVTVTYDYDNNGNRTGVSTSSGSTTYTFSSRNLVKTAVAGTATTNFEYYPDNKQKSITYPSGAGIAYTYFPTDRVKTVINTGAGNAVISSFGYGYDRNGNRTSQVETRSAFNETTTYRYDNLDRMQSFTVVNGSDTTTTDYTFDGYNRASESTRKNGSTIVYRSYNYDETERLTSVQVSEAGVNKTINYTYDKNGNTVRKQDTTEPEVVLYDYDSSNQMVRAMKGSTLLGLYDYNAEGLRIRHRNSERGDVDYWYDGRAVLEEEKNGSLLAHYRYAGKLLSLLNGGEIQYYHFDALGSTVNLTDTAGTKKTGYFLDPWGHVKGKEGESVNRQIFTGQEHDENTGLINFGARYYDPDVARFITEDSYLGEQGTPSSLNRYLYAYSNPTVYVDLQGYASVSAMIDKAAEGCSGAGCYGWAFLKTAYTFSTLGFSSIHDPQRDAYDAGKTSGTGYVVKGIGGGSAMVAVNVMTGRVAGAAMAGKPLLQQSLIGAATGATLGTVNDTAAQFSNIDAGYQQEYNFKQTAVSGTVGAAIGGVAPSIGTLTQKLGQKLAQKQSGSFLKKDVKSPAPEPKLTGEDVSGKPDGGVLSDSALVCRGGECTAKNFTQGTGVEVDIDTGKLSGISTQSKDGATIEDLSKPFKNNQVGVTTAGEIRKAGGQIVPDGTRKNPNHATVSGITAEKAEELFTPTQQNPVPKDERGL